MEKESTPRTVGSETGLVVPQDGCRHHPRPALLEQPLRRAQGIELPAQDADAEEVHLGGCSKAEYIYIYIYIYENTRIYIYMCVF